MATKKFVKTQVLNGLIHTGLNTLCSGIEFAENYIYAVGRLGGGSTTENTNPKVFTNFQDG